MKNSLLKVSLIAGFVASFIGAQAQVSCPGAAGSPQKIIFGTNKAGVGTKITTNRLFDKDTIYILKDYVRVAAGATLTIEPGTIIMGAPAPTDTSCLIIERGAQIIANGTQLLPIVFTSCKQVGVRERGDWGGLVILGKAVNNQGTNVQLEGNYAAFHGGTDDNDNSGTLRFVRVEFAGASFEANRELNGITLGSVGKATTFRNIQVSFGKDDAFEWFGGTVSGTNLIAWKTLDDDFDVDFGYSGINQFGLAYRDPEVADISGSESFECDNDGNNSSLTPKTSATFSNFEAWGPITTTSISRINPFYRAAAHLRRNTEVDFYNTLLIGYPSDSAKKQAAGFWIENASTVQNVVNGLINLRCNVVAAYGTPKRILSSEPFASWAPFATPEALYNRAADKNVIAANVLLTSKKAPLKYEPLFTLLSGAPMGTGSSFTTAGVLPALPVAAYPNGFTSVAYRGAFGGTDWAANWTEYRPNLMVYTAGLPTRKAAQDNFLANGSTNSGNSVLCMPNPTVGATTINFSFDIATAANVSIVDMAGTSLYNVSATFNEGVNTVDFDAANLAEGTYLVKVSSNGALIKTGKLQIVK